MNDRPTGELLETCAGCWRRHRPRIGLGNPTRGPPGSRPRAGEAPVGWMHHVVEDEPRCVGISTDVKKAKIKQLTGRYPSKKSEKSRHASRQRAGLAGAGQGRAGHRPFASEHSCFAAEAAAASVNSILPSCLSSIPSLSVRMYYVCMHVSGEAPTDVVGHFQAAGAAISGSDIQ